MAEVRWTPQALDDLEAAPEADAIVSTSFFRADLLGIDPLPPVDRVIGNPQMISGQLRDHYVPTADPLPTLGATTTVALLGI